MRNDLVAVGYSIRIMEAEKLPCYHTVIENCSIFIQHPKFYKTIIAYPLAGLRSHC